MFFTTLPSAVYNPLKKEASFVLSLKNLLGILNSKLLSWYYSINFSNKSKLTVNISKTYLEKLPIKEIENKKNSKERKIMKRFLMNEEGQGMVEYGLIIALVAVVVIVGLTLLGGQAKNLFSNISERLTTGS